MNQGLTPSSFPLNEQKVVGPRGERASQDNCMKCYIEFKFRNGLLLGIHTSEVTSPKALISRLRC